jgi:GNAT superfamily N-acetyltransferase
VDLVHGFLATSYWARAIPREIVERSIRNSLCFGLYDAGGRQVGFARVVTDRATFAWVADVFVVEEARGNGLGVWLMEAIATHPDLQGLRRLMLTTRDAQVLYAKTGFVRPARPEEDLERWDPEIYTRNAPQATSD